MTKCSRRLNDGTIMVDNCGIVMPKAENPRGGTLSPLSKSGGGHGGGRGAVS